MRISILAHGSRGDVQPYLALGVGLRRAGHQVRLAAPELFRGFVAEYGLEFAPLAGDPRRLMLQAVDKAGAGASLLQQTWVMLDYVLPVAVQVMADARQACQGAQAIVQWDSSAPRTAWLGRWRSSRSRTLEMHTPHTSGWHAINFCDKMNKDR